MYSVSAYNRMIADSVRAQAYAAALRQVIKPDSVVLEIGAGTGFFSMLACQFGARKVYAIEPDSSIQLAREIAEANGYADRIEFIQALSTKVTLPELADVVISDLRGILPLFQRHLPSIADARRRLLAPGGVLIPRADTLWVAVIEAPELHQRQLGLTEDCPYGIDMRATRRLALNRWGKGRVTPTQLLVEPQVWARLDYAVIETPDVQGELTWQAQRAATAHGLSVWFEADLAAGSGFSTGPTTPEMIYGTAFLPFQEPVKLLAGDTICVTLQADLVVNDYLWRWHTRVLRAGELWADFQQSTFYGTPLALAQLHKLSDRYLPQLNEQGRIDQFILGLMTGELPQGEIARRVLAQFPQHFAGWKEALTQIGELAKKYSQ